jgi:hypothetical protein
MRKVFEKRDDLCVEGKRVFLDCIKMFRDEEVEEIIF